MMEIDFLRHYGFSSLMIDILVSDYGEYLLPLQERIIKDGCLFEGNNLLVCAPTSSGKTFLAELLFLHHTLKNRNTILLVPTKALANQRFRELKERYEKHGYQVLLSTRDHPFHDKQITGGHFHLAIVIYEKMRTFLSNNNGLLAMAGAYIVDEIHYLHHPTRGPDLEILLTRLREEQSLQILGLSAMHSSPEMSRWLDARIIVDQKRPVDLRQGVLCKGRFSYKEFNSGEQGVEQLFDSETDDEGEAMLEAARYFAAKGETTLLFWPQRDQCYTAARKLAAQYECEEGVDFPELDNLEPTAMRDFLLGLLPRGIAVHSSDLSAQERNLVERLARDGKLRLICATSTLAEGINLPVVNVLTTRRMYASQPGRSKQNLAPASIPISKDRLLNMIGRAGRMGLSDFGRGIIITTFPGDVEGLLAAYMDSRQVALPSILNQISFEEIVLKTMGFCGCFTVESCKQTLNQTLCGHLGLLPKELDNLLNQTCEELTQRGFLNLESERFYLTPLGEAITKSGLSEHSARRINDYILLNISEVPEILDVLVLICALPEMGDIFIPVSRNEIQAHRWSRAITQKTDESAICAGSYLGQLIAEPARLRAEHHSAFKKSLLLWDWIAGYPASELEKRYGVYSGTIYRISEESSWLLGCLSDIAASHALPEQWTGRITTLRDRIQQGLPGESLAWADYIRRGELLRSNVLALIGMGFESPSRISHKDREQLASLLSEDALDKIIQPINESLGNADENLAEKTVFLVEIDKRQPKRIRVNEKEITLTPLQYRLIKTLAGQTECCVSYDIILEQLWPESIGDRKQISRQKTNFIKKIEKTLGIPCSDIIESVAGMGLILHAKVNIIDTLRE